MGTLPELEARVRALESDLIALRLLDLEVLPGDIVASKVRQYKSALGWYPLDVYNKYTTWVNTSSQFTFYSVKIPKGTLGANNLVMIWLVCGFQNNSGATRTLTSTVTINGTDYSFGAADNVAASATWRPYPYRFLLYGNGSALAQRYWGFNEDYSDSWRGALALNAASVDIQLDFKMTMSVAHVSFQFERHHCRTLVYLNQ